MFSAIWRVSIVGPVHLSLQCLVCVDNLEVWISKQREEMLCNVRATTEAAQRSYQLTKNSAILKGQRKGFFRSLEPMPVGDLESHFFYLNQILTDIRKDVLVTMSEKAISRYRPFNNNKNSRQKSVQASRLRRRREFHKIH